MKAKLKSIARKILDFRLSGLLARWQVRTAQSKANWLTEDQQDLLALMRADNQKAGMPFAPMAQWEPLTAEFSRIMKIEGIGQVETQYYNQRFSQSQLSSTRYYRSAMWMLYQAIKTRDTRNLLDRISATIPSNSGYVCEFDGRRVTWDILISLDTIYAIAEIEPRILDESIVLADLGAGWGRIGYVLMQVNPKITNIDLDLPEPLLIAEKRLSELFPDRTFFHYKDIRQMERITRANLEQGGFWFCGSQDLLRIEDGSIDVFINVASFQEMTKRQVAAYLGLIDRKTNGLLYVQEYWSNPGEHQRYNAIAGLDEYEFPSQWQRCFLRNATFSNMFFEAAFKIHEDRK